MKAQSSTSAEPSTVRLSGLQLDALVAVLSWLLIAGVAADFRSHAQGISFAEEGFFTPEHVFFYSMFLLIAVVVGAVTYQHRRAGAAWTDAVPSGYGWAVVGVLVFGIGGIADLGWHSAFGFEEGVEALTSPSHLTLVLGCVLFIAAPLRAALLRDDRLSGTDAIPAVISASLVLTAITLFAGYANPISSQLLFPIYGAASYAAILALIVFPTLLVGAALILDRVGKLPFGSVTVLVFHSALAGALVTGIPELLLPVLAAGLFGDAIAYRGESLLARPRALRAFGFVLPATFATAYFLVHEAIHGVTWTVHVWTGTIALAGAGGLLLTYVVLPTSPRATASDPT